MAEPVSAGNVLDGDGEPVQQRADHGVAGTELAVDVGRAGRRSLTDQDQWRLIEEPQLAQRPAWERTALLPLGSGVTHWVDDRDDREVQPT
jgi:hypothetical protein